MAQDPVKVPLNPDVPPAPGVPSVRRDPLVEINKVQLLAADVLTVVEMFQAPQWGIFTTGGVPFVIPDTIVAVDLRAEARISDYPVEGGGFQSYDKVILPYDARVEMVCSGLLMDKNVFINSLDKARQALDLFVIVTPEATFPRVNVIHYDVRRTRHRGASILYADVWFEEVRDTVTTQFTSSADLSNAQNPNSLPDANKGTVQTIPGFVQGGQTFPGYIQGGQPIPGFIMKPPV